MAKDKYDFILELIANKKLSLNQKDRVLNLYALELKKDGQLLNERLEMIISENKIDLELIKRIEEVESKMRKLNDEQNAPLKPAEETKIRIEPNPKHVADFMSLFNQRDGLKYLTHDYDENDDFEIDKILIQANKVFTEATKKLFIPQSLWRTVKQFAFDSKQTEWTSISADYTKPIPITIGWATKELRNWSKQNKLHPIRNNEYKNIIKDFKRITRIEAPDFEILIDKTLGSVFADDIENFEVQKNALEKADFYSHVGYLKAALEAIFEEIKKRSDSSLNKKISIHYERSISDEGYYLREVLITHHNSFPSKELKLILQEWNEKGNMGKIKEKLRGYCHWSVETIIEEKATKVNILRDKESPDFELIDKVPVGFTHILTFYYK
ncbi:MAG: hypothetical protein A2W93_10020 [Bacteroidetes bacterium GWF2_43_63]|nr:MAG: hypothetical protein A2W94_02450 [Bacteroidetes bacterium GWE2_42_42]OFY52859.1 MAG: hypothetical protein A2W93_10020 [Bacteroidetes bacterium GWF2_43_63]HBG70064.1 hypothetical protein [Bacteroidales bacterium]HCB62329.1 hypothetical protein [Bacteroidales bacterium]